MTNEVGRVEGLLAFPDCTFIEWKTDGPNGMLMAYGDVIKIARTHDATIASLTAERDVLKAALKDLVEAAEKANNYATRHEHFNLPQVGEGYIDAGRAALAGDGVGA